MTTLLPRFLPAGDTALTIELATGAGLSQSQRVLALWKQIADASIDGIVEVVPAIRSLTVHYDPVRTSSARLRETLRPWAENAAAPPFDEAGDPDAEILPPLAGRRWLIPACYAPDFGPDIAEVAAPCGLTPWQVTALHACLDYRVLMLGFLPGFPYMGDLPPPLCIPRRDTPRTNVPAGSIAIATTMSVIYPQESPGGWHIIARTPVRLFDPARAEPSLLAPGDEIRFRPVDADEFAAIASATATGWSLQPRDAGS